jgi:hypothetical protein
MHQVIPSLCNLRVLALGQARIQVTKDCSYLFWYTLSYDFPTPKASDQKSESIFAIAVICSPRTLGISYYEVK